MSENTKTLVYDFVQSLARWKLLRVLNAQGEPEPLPKETYFHQVASLTAYAEATYPDTTLVLHRRDPCRDNAHSLAGATLRYWSQNGQVAFLRCPCKRPRQVSRADWVAVHGEA